jgi:predicted PurR-regulated permease PerM
MNYKEISKGIIRAVLIILAFGLGLFLLNEIQILISYVIIAAVVSLVGRPFVRFFTEKLKFKNTSASILSMMILIGIVVGIISLFVPLVIEQGKNLSLLEVDSFKENILFLYSELSSYLSSYGLSLDNSIFNINWLNNIDFTFLPEILNSIGKTLGNLTIGILSVMFISFFFLKDSKLIINSLLVLIPKKIK